MGKFVRLVIKTDTFSLSECTEGFYLYDYIVKMNIAMYAKTEQEAFIKALNYYQRRLVEVKTMYEELDGKVESFLSQFMDEE